jgi:SAM-dependent methyltransferase
MADERHHGKRLPRNLGSSRRGESKSVVSDTAATRLDLRMSANLLRRGNIRYGRTTHISFDGVAMVFDGPVPVTVNQPIRLGLLTGACIFELRGTVEAIREMAGSSGIEGEVSTSDVAVRFDPIVGLERQVLGSLLEAFRNHCLAVSMATLLISEEAEELFLRAGAMSHAQQAPPSPAVPSERCASTPKDLGPWTDQEERTFWEEYLGHFHFILNVPEYWQLLDRLCRLMGENTGETLILDAGCGHANLGQFLLIEQAYRHRHRSQGDRLGPRYIGMDFIANALVGAKEQLSDRAFELSVWRSGMPADDSGVRTALCCADLNRPLPFHEGQFDRVVCNLVLAYLHDPLLSLQELMRILASGGRLILAILKPVADPMAVYQEFLDRLERREDRVEAGWMLQNWPSIQLMEYLAQRRIRDGTHLEQIIESLGAENVRTYPVMADQAYLTIADKPAAG